MREIKFRAWDDICGEMKYSEKWGMSTFWDMFCDFNIMQYTGLKDKNGKEIYEGDILKSWHRVGRGFRENSVEAVEYSEITARFYPEDLVVCCEVIGNIYENPELLGGYNE